MTTIPALYQITTGSFNDFTTRNAVYPLGVPAFVTSGANAGRLKIGDGVTQWANLPFVPPQATETVLGIIKSSVTHLFGRVNADGTLIINGLEADLSAIQQKDAEQDGYISDIQTQLAGMSGTIIYIGSVNKYTDELKAMNAAARNALLTAQAVGIRGQVMDGYTLQDLGIEDEAGRFSYWQYQPDGTWFDLGERGDVSQATDTSLGIVMGSGAQYKIHIEPDGTMSVNNLSDKLTALDSKDEELETAIETNAENLETFQTAQEGTNQELGDAIAAETDRAQEAEGGLAGDIAAETERATNTEGSLSETIGGEIERAQAAEASALSLSKAYTDSETDKVFQYKKDISRPGNYTNKYLIFEAPSYSISEYYEFYLEVDNWRFFIRVMFASAALNSIQITKVQELGNSHVYASGNLIFYADSSTRQIALFLNGSGSSVKTTAIYDTKSYEPYFLNTLYSGENATALTVDESLLPVNTLSLDKAVLAINNQLDTKSDIYNKVTGYDYTKFPDLTYSGDTPVNGPFDSVKIDENIDVSDFEGDDSYVSFSFMNDTDNTVWGVKVSGGSEPSIVVITPSPDSEAIVLWDGVDILIDKYDFPAVLRYTGAGVYNGHKDGEKYVLAVKNIITPVDCEANSKEIDDESTRAVQVEGSLSALTTTLQTTDPPTFVVSRITVTAGGTGYAAGDAVTLSDPPVAAVADAVDENGAITSVSFNVETVYDSDPAGKEIEVIGGGGEGAVCEVRTAYAPGDVQVDGELIFVPYVDPIVQTSRMRGFTRDYLEGSGVSQQVTRLDAMRKWSPFYLYAEGDVTYIAGSWYTPNPENIPVFGESPVSSPEKWVNVSGGSDVDALQVIKNKRRIDALWSEVFGDGVVFTNHFALDFYTMEGVNLEEGVWRDSLGRVEV